MQEERILHEAKLSKMEAEMKMVFQQKVQEKESKLKQSEEELYARHKEMKDALDKQRTDLEDKKRKIESGRPLTPEKNAVSALPLSRSGGLSLVLRPKTVASSGRELDAHVWMVRFVPCYSTFVVVRFTLFTLARAASSLPFSSLASVHCPSLLLARYIALWNIFHTRLKLTFGLGYHLFLLV